MRKQIIIAIALALGLCSCNSNPLDNDYDKDTISEDMKSMPVEDRVEVFKGMFAVAFSGEDMEGMTYREIIEFREELLEKSKP